MTSSRLTRGVAWGAGALETGALVLAAAPSATADEGSDDPRPERFGAVLDRPYMGARIAITDDGATVLAAVATLLAAVLQAAATREKHLFRYFKNR